MVKRVVLIRHGQSTWNTKSWIQGRADSSVLTPKGEAQAAACQQALATLQFDQGFASPLQRARRTAEIIWGERPEPLTFSNNLLEIDLPLWEGLTPAEATERFPELHAIYRTDPANFIMEGRYPIVALWEQAQQAWQQILAASGSCVLVVAHNAINQALIATALGLGVTGFRRLTQTNGGITILNFAEDGQAQLESLNQTGHIEPTNFASKNGQTRILLVRHGETQWNREGRFQGQMDIPLNPTGVEQAQKTAQLLHQTTLDQAYSSPLLRSYQTAEAIVAGRDLALQTVPDLQEISHGTWEGKLHAEVESQYPGMLAQWNTHPETVQMPEGENLADVWERSQRAWEAVLATATGKTTLVVAHDAVNKALLCQLVGLGSEGFWRFKQGNGSVTVIDYVEERGHLHSCNYTAHFGGGVLDCTAAGAL